MEAVAIANYLKISPKKVNRVLATIRNKTASESIRILKILPHRAASLVLKTLLSAIANAKNNQGINVNDLEIAKAVANEGVRMKRMQPMARGSAGAILKRTSNVIIAVKTKEEK